MRKLGRRFCSEQGGQVGVMVAALIIPITMAGGGALDFTRAMALKDELQRALDAGTISAAMMVGGEDARRRTGASVFASNYARVCSSEPDFAFAGDTVTSSVSCAVDTFFLSIAGIPALDIGAESEVVIGEDPEGTSVLADACVIALAEDGKGFDYTASGTFDADCSIYTRSTAPKSIDISMTGNFRASSLITVGDHDVIVNGDTMTGYMPGAPMMEDPLADLAAPVEAEGGCDYTDANPRSRAEIVLSPGVYCGGLKIVHSGDTTLMPGVYVFRDGNFKYSASGNLHAEDVLLYFEGDSILDSSAGGDIVIKGLKGGELAGMAIMQLSEKAGGGGPTASSFSTSGDMMIEGTVYLPRTDLSIAQTGDPSNISSYTAYIANRFKWTNSGHWKIRSNYNTGTPLPEELRRGMAESPARRVARVVR